MVNGLSRPAADRLIETRKESPFACVDDLVLRAVLSRGDRERLAAAGALRGLAGHRRLARWEALGSESHPLPLLRGVRVPEPAPCLPRPTEGEDVVEDYAALGLTLGRHPVALLRERLALEKCLPAARVNALPHGRPARVAGIVVTRQRPGTAKDVTFVTLEDETGTVNIVIWRDLADRRHRELIGSRLLAVSGRIEREGSVVHLIASRLTDVSPLLGELTARSRDFR